jgi:ABC-type branched-subunit amino acid transport system substrate-binding protein
MRSLHTARTGAAPAGPARRPRSRRRAGLRALASTLAGALLAAPLAAVVTVASTAPPAAATPSCQSSGKVTAAEAAATTGITKNSVTVGNVSTISGPVPGLFEGAPIGAKAYFAYINSKGGVNGRKLDVQSMDDSFNGQVYSSDAQTALDSDFAMVGNFSLLDSYGCKILAADPGFPDVSVTLDPGTNALPNDFSAQPLAQGLGAGQIKYVRKLYPKAKKLGTIVSTTATAIAQWQGEEGALKRLGFTITYVQKISPLTTDFTTQVIKMRNDGVQVLWLTALDWQTAAILTQDMVQQGWHPTVVLSGGPIYADQFIAKAGGASATDGDWIGQAQALYLGQDAQSTPAVGRFLKWVQSVHPGWTPDLFTLYGWVSAQLFVEALQKAGKNPTRGSVLAQLQKISAFTATGLLAPTNPAKKLPSKCFVLARIEHGQFVRVVPKTSGFTCTNGSFYYANGKTLS